MCNEEFEKKAAFLLQQQADSAARIAELEDLVTQFARETRARVEAANEPADDDETHP